MSNSRKGIIIQVSIVIMVFGNALSAQAGYVRHGVKKGWHETKHGFKKGTSETSTGIKKGWHSTKREFKKFFSL